MSILIYLISYFILIFLPELLFHRALNDLDSFNFTSIRNFISSDQEEGKLSFVYSILCKEIILFSYYFAYHKPNSKK